MDTISILLGATQERPSNVSHDFINNDLVPLFSGAETGFSIFGVNFNKRGEVHSVTKKK